MFANTVSPSHSETDNAVEYHAAPSRPSALPSWGDSAVSKPRTSWQDNSDNNDDGPENNAGISSTARERTQVSDPFASMSSKMMAAPPPTSPSTSTSATSPSSAPPPSVASVGPVRPIALRPTATTQLPPLDASATSAHFLLPQLPGTASSAAENTNNQTPSAAAAAAAAASALGNGSADGKGADNNSGNANEEALCICGKPAEFNCSRCGNRGYCSFSCQRT